MRVGELSKIPEIVVKQKRGKGNKYFKRGGRAELRAGTLLRTMARFRGIFYKEASLFSPKLRQ